MDGTRESTYERLRPPDPTPADELCGFWDDTPVKLVGAALFYNPIHCLECNGEVPPERLKLDPHLAEALATWLFTYRAIDSLELASGEYEMWARGQLMDLDSLQARLEAPGWDRSFSTPPVSLSAKRRRPVH